MTDPSTTPDRSSGSTSSSRLPSRVVLVADETTLWQYEPVLRRMMLGLIDEIDDLTLLCLGRCALANFVPCPPVRLLTETRKDPTYEQFDVTSREVTIRAPRSRLINLLLPHRRIKRLANALTTYKPTLLHALGENQGHLVRQLSKQLHLPYVVTYLPLEGQPSQVSSPRCTAVICCNSKAARQTRQSRKIPASQVHLIPIGTHVSQESVAFNHEQDTTNLFYIGPLEEGLGLAELINVLRRLLNNDHQCHLTLCGQGAAKRHLRQQTQRLGLTEQVHFTPPLTKFIQHSQAGKILLKSSDIFVQPCPSHNLRPEWLDAMSVGVVLVAAQGPPCDLFVENQTAAIVPFRDEDRLLETLENLITNPSHAMQLAHQAQEHLRKHFQTSHMVERMGNAYRQAIETFAALKNPPQPEPRA
ncbi:MAG: glycosyltransferase family 4 protein [Sedimentisphaerales bacterium]|nr:glycosyltransferase family 4 protein [Sedimentisphaerales bacterium]